MSTAEHKTTTEMENMSIARRILEIMDEKGETIRGFASRLNMSRETLRLILVGERPVSPSEIEEIANGLGITMARLKQTDTYKQHEEVKALFKSKNRTKPVLLRTHAIAAELVEVALGATERGFRLHDLGRVQYVQEQYEVAHNTWIQTLEYAKELQEKYNENRLLHLVTTNLMLTSTISKEYSNIESLLVVVEKEFAEDYEKLGMAQYTRMKMQEDRGNVERAKQHAIRSLELFQLTGDPLQIGTALLNVGHYEFLFGNFNECKKLLSSALEHVKSHDDICVHVVKNYVKTLMKLKDYQSAVQIIDEYTALAKEYPEYWAKIKVMYAVAKDEPSFADSVINDTSASTSVRYIASKCLMEYFYLKGDAEQTMRYYEKVRIFSHTKSEYLDEEEL
ncbi:hypothetical protein CBW65_20030 [Tumebacillus avium]|uniref:HTH cro/C1-type domain-containing protein n=1 Tax=Tumebacillus avium TaxID=1903704 RepID=A0A1Y0IT85_9BACL|nr:helix-turn-helix transcriptional regulator [Tumebacillus avium]ARU63006.1 hypothetical protein CBW65_20030 [Tumebacillus avium]